MIVPSLSALSSLAVSLLSSPITLLKTDEPGLLLPSGVASQLGGWSFYTSKDGLYGIEDELPAGCEVDQVSLLTRHSYRGPSGGVNKGIEALLPIFGNSSFKSLSPELDFLEHLDETFIHSTAELLTPWGGQEAYSAGVSFGRRYDTLIGQPGWYYDTNWTSKLLVRSTDQQRMNMTSRIFAAGLLGEDWQSRTSLLINADSAPDVNNTLATGTCVNSANVSSTMFSVWNGVYLPKLVARLQKKMSGVDLTVSIVSAMQNACAFQTANGGALSPFCNVFSDDEWLSFSYGQDLQSWTNAGYGGPLGRAWGVGWVNELIARLTNTPVLDSTTTNSTIVSNSTLFPLDRSVYLDFSHDSQLESAVAVMGLLQDTEPLSATNRLDERLWKTANISPMAARLFAERISCKASSTIKTRRSSTSDLTGSYVRIVLNGAVVPLWGLSNCSDSSQPKAAVEAGLCSLQSFVASQQFAQTGGDWANCVCSTPSCVSNSSSVYPGYHYL